MSSHKILDLSESEEMYILTIAQLNEAGHDGLVSLTEIARELEVLPVSVNQMIRKLADQGYVDYQPYKGVELRPEGRRHAWHILRYRRLWETFLTQHLEISSREAAALACRLEHITPFEVMERLYHFLGEPAFTLQGKPIPPLEHEVALTPPQPLNALPVGQNAEVARLDAANTTRQFLECAGILPGAQVKVVAVGGGMMLVEVNGERASLREDICAQVNVYPLAESS